MGKRLLLADDSVTIQKVVEITFADKDYELDLASNGDEALQKAQNLRPDLILADVFMPGLDGYQLCEQIKNMSEMAAVPVLLLAGTFEPFDEERAGQVGAAGWISKPFASQALVDKVEQVLAEVAEQEQEWQTTPSKSPADSMLNAFEQASATAFGSGRSDELSAEDTRSAPVSGPASDGEKTAPADPRHQEKGTSDFATGEREDFSFEDLASADATPPEPAQEETHPDASVSPEPDLTPLDETPSIPADDFSFTPAEPEPAVKSAPADAPPADPFAEAEQSSDIPADEKSTSAPQDFSFSVDIDKTDTEPELPDLDEFTAPAPEAEIPPLDTGVQQEAEHAATSAGADVIELQEDDIVAEGKYAATPSRVEARAAYLSDEELERIVERVAGSVIERLATPLMEKVVWEVVPDLAESMIREEMQKIRQHADVSN
ncbi:MAG: response regulator [Geobacteraceae bacterium]|nr:response regulator [Geobacteraceae bacterium]